MRGVPARLPCRTAPRTPVPAIPPADGPLACRAVPLPERPYRRYRRLMARSLRSLLRASPAPLACQCRTSTPVPAIPLVPIARKHVPISTGNRARNRRAPAKNALHFRYQILFTLRRDGEHQEKHLVHPECKCTNIDDKHAVHQRPGLPIRHTSRRRRRARRRWGNKRSMGAHGNVGVRPTGSWCACSSIRRTCQMTKAQHGVSPRIINHFPACARFAWMRGKKGEMHGCSRTRRYA